MVKPLKHGQQLLPSRLVEIGQKINKVTLSQSKFGILLLELKCSKKWCNNSN